MIEYCVYLKLNGAVAARMQKLRVKFDPLAHSVPPHVTLVFPFQSRQGGRWVEDSVTSVFECARRFHFTLGPAKAVKAYVYFPLLEGASQAVRLHQVLYSTKEMQEFRSLEHVYEPHVTFGRYQNEAELGPLLQEAGIPTADLQGELTEAVLESFESDGQGTILRTWALS